ncbi:ATP-binding cassette domain-containing protein [Anaerococcus porci]|uniref:ABC transporter ATP-binding protein n=1 Tax=Anaerococcus porci TaxID=2652269 RepID=A0A6N7VRQ6_9FIRM|nr:ATP-binding cassette domain-containing protein [Anaerococcus porci]MDY3006534.1 ATP-binding cassette domain-containing protein [Anaerococcus porci]MSS77522.1 ABC transporter ATP-binding protein [Anaerococcus porci]
MKKIKGYLIDQKSISKEEKFLEEKQLLNIETFYEKFRNDLIRKVKYESVIYNIFVYGTLNFSITLTTIISIILIAKGEMTAGDYTAVSLYISNLWSPMLDLFNIRREYVSSKPALKSYNKFLNIDSMNFNNEKIRGIILKDYVGLGSDGKKLHKPLNIKFDKDRVNLIVGSNGVGKTTLAESILNLSNRYEGQILINGNILNKQIDILYKDIVYIPSEPIISQYGILNKVYNGSSGQKN